MRWIPATERLPIGKNYQTLNIKYKGNASTLVLYHDAWFWSDNSFNESYQNPVFKDSWSAIEWLDEQSDEWISVDTPPPTNEEFNESDYYLCLLESTEQVVCWYNSKDKAWRVGNFKADSLPLENITHYRSLPQPPKQ